MRTFDVVWRCVALPSLLLFCIYQLITIIPKTFRELSEDREKVWK